VPPHNAISAAAQRLSTRCWRRRMMRANGIFGHPARAWAWACKCVLGRCVSHEALCDFGAFPSAHKTQMHVSLRFWGCAGGGFVPLPRWLPVSIHGGASFSSALHAQPPPQRLYAAPFPPAWRAHGVWGCDRPTGMGRVPTEFAEQIPRRPQPRRCAKAASACPSGLAPRAALSLRQQRCRPPRRPGSPFRG
jgi:hypothetical protein